MRPIMDLRVSVYADESNCDIKVISSGDRLATHHVIGLDGEITYDMMYGPIAETFCEALIAKIDQLKKE